MLDTLSFTFTQLLSLIGLTQAIYILVHILVSKGFNTHSLTPLAYFTALSFAFFLDFGWSELAGLTRYYESLQWLFWLYLPPLSVLFILHIASSSEKALKPYLLLLALPFLAWGTSVALTNSYSGCNLNVLCEEFGDWLLLCGALVSTISLLSLGFNKQLFERLRGNIRQKSIYWIVLSLIVMDAGLIAVILSGLQSDFNAQNQILARTLIGLAFIYLTTTSLFRILPTLKDSQPKTTAHDLTSHERAIAKKIDKLLFLDKVYQEPSYSRNDLARELEISEISLSRIINVYYKKSFPKLMNEYRLKDAKQLLHETKASIKIISEEVGFNSLASFNRVFKEEIGMTPSEYRQNKPA